MLVRSAMKGIWKRISRLPAVFPSGLLALALMLAACGGTKLDSGAPKGSQGDQYLLELGKKGLEDKNWEDARGYFRQLLDTYPRSELAGDARIGVADSYFHQRGSGNLVLAISEYRDFLTFFPNHPRADYAQYQIAMGYYNQMHNPDRDQEPTRTAAAEFEKLIELYRNSLYADKARELLQQCYERLAEHEFRVGEFYLKSRKACRGAIARFKGVLENYPTYSNSDEVYFLLGEAHQMCARPMEAMPYYKQLIENYPQSELVAEAKHRLDTLEAQVNGASKHSPPTF